MTNQGAPGPGGRPGAAGTAHPGGGPGVTGAAGRQESGDPAAGGRAAEPGTPDTAPPRLRRDRRHRMIAGVCAGLGRQCDMDPVIFRITLSVLAATGGIGLIFYGFAWLLVMEDGEEENEVRKLLTGRVDGPTLAAVLFALVGCGVFLSMLRNGGVLAFAVVVSLLLAGAGYWSLHRGAPDQESAPGARQGAGLAAQAVADAPPEAQAPPVPAAHASWWRDPIVKDGTHVGGTGYLWGPQDVRDPGVAAPGRDRAAHDGRLGRAGRVAVARDRGPRRIGGPVFLLALVAGGLGTALTWDGHPLGTSLQTGLACALAVFGLGIALSAFVGRTGAGTVFWAVVTAALLAGSTALPQDVSTHWARRTWQPATAADVRPAYDFGTGAGTLDLTRVRPGAGRTVSTRAEMGAGRLRVVVPADVTVRMAVDVGVGDIQLPGDGPKDVDVAPGRHRRVTLPPAAGTRDAGTLGLDLQIGLGQVEVSRAAS
ncbi:PspC domain-containing protein [Streptomyces tropicalis]|uniref:PspC domain-containing protein n=1 Tax=Streptomyces tropicalis TaxID=3034234 RepID=A0ABT6A8V6_9ACTN|nr:PspC domain-containing protein [Streptomyces tropicalis]MDF3301079.1 PspC domain-containing protein [Streptomyces tropicalis]